MGYCSGIAFGPLLFVILPQISLIAKIVRPPNFQVQVLSLSSASPYLMFPRPAFVFVLTFVNSGWLKLNYVRRDREISSLLSRGSLASFSFPFLSVLLSVLLLLLDYLFVLFEGIMRSMAEDLVNDDYDCFVFTRS